MSLAALTGIASVVLAVFRKEVYHRFVKDRILPEQMLTILLLTLFVLALVLILETSFLLRYYKLSGKLKQLEKDSRIHDELNTEILRLNTLLDKKLDNNDIANIKVSRIMKAFYTKIAP
jgi:predicted PurR-regulated permease PerM